MWVFSVWMQEVLNLKKKVIYRADIENKSQRELKVGYDSFNAPPALTCTPRGRCWAGWPGGGSSCRSGSARWSGRSGWVCRAAPAAGRGGKRSSLPPRGARTSAPGSPPAGPGKTGSWWPSSVPVPPRPASPAAAQPGAAEAEGRGCDAASLCAAVLKCVSAEKKRFPCAMCLRLLCPPLS